MHFMCREDVSNNLTLAVAPDDFKDEAELDANDFLIRGIVGIDPKGGAIAVGETVGVGKRIRFMVGPVDGWACSQHYHFTVHTVTAQVYHWTHKWKPFEAAYCCFWCQVSVHLCCLTCSHPSSCS